MPGDENNAALMEFVRTANIAAFTKQLETETDPARRKLLMTLLEEQRALAPPGALGIRRVS